MAVNVTAFKAYARLSPDDTDPTAQLCLDAAVQHAHDAGISDALDENNDPKYALYIYALALHYHENRGMSPLSQAYAVDTYAQRLMTKFRVELAAKGDG